MHDNTEKERGAIEVSEHDLSRKQLTNDLNKLGEVLSNIIQSREGEKPSMSKNWNRSICSKCGGHGEIDGEPCPECGGTGEALPKDDRQYPRGREVKKSSKILK